MKNRFKLAIVGGLATLGLASGAIAQQSSTKKPATSAQVNQRMMQGNGSMSHGNMMNNPQMREQMSKMMADCHKMMGRMSMMSGDSSLATPRTK